MLMRRPVLGVSLLAMTALIGCGGGSQQKLTGTTRGKPQPPAAPVEKIVFNNGLKLSTINPDGTNERAITSLQDWFAPAWSRCKGPDGKYMIAGSTEAGLCVANADGTGVRVLVPTDTGSTVPYAGSPCWSPDGSEIVYTQTAKVTDHGGWLRTVNVATRAVTDFGVRCWSPAWSRVKPDRIAYFHFVPYGEPVGLEVIARDPSTGTWSAPATIRVEPSQVGGTGISNFHAWSDPDASGQEWFAVSKEWDPGIWVTKVGADGLPDGNQWQAKHMTGTSGVWWISWSPDAKHLAHKEGLALGVLDVETGTENAYTVKNYGNLDPDWSPKMQ